MIAFAALIHWGWELDPKPDLGRVEIGGGISLPTYMSGPLSHAWWAMVVLLAVAASLYACLVFSYLYLWLVSPQVWPQSLPSPAWPGVAAGALLLSSAIAGWCNRRLSTDRSIVPLWLAIPFLVAAFVANLVSLPTPPAQNSYGAIIHAFAVLDGFFVACATVLAVFALARERAGRLDRVRRVTFDNARLFWHYTVAQTLAGLAVVHGFPRLVA